jgi:hypothetical protein
MILVLGHVAGVHLRPTLFVPFAGTNPGERTNFHVPGDPGTIRSVSEQHEHLKSRQNAWLEASVYSVGYREAK